MKVWQIAFVAFMLVVSALLWFVCQPELTQLDPAYVRVSINLVTEAPAPLEHRDMYLYLRPRPKLKKPYRGGPIQDGDQAIVDDFRWIKLVTKIKDRPVDDACSIKAGSVVTVEAVENSSILVAYDYPYYQGGAECPSGAKFRLSADEFRSMTAQYERFVAAAEKEYNLVQGMLLGGEPASLGLYHGGNVEPGHEIVIIAQEWVTVLFAPGEKPEEGPYILYPGNRVKVIGVAADRVLVRYSTEEAHGTACPDGKIFFISKAAFTH